MLRRKTCWFIVNRRRRKVYYVLIEDFNTFMYHHTLQRGKNIFAVIIYKILVQTIYQKVKTALTLIKKRKIMIPKKGKYVQFKIFDKYKIIIQHLCRFQKYIGAKRKGKVKSIRILFEQISKTYCLLLYL